MKMKKVSLLPNIKNFKKFFSVCYDNDEEHCQGLEESNLLAWLGMFIVAQALVGFACNAFYTVGFAFIEEQSEVAMAGIYFGLVRMGSSAGPIAGYIGLG